MSAARLFFAVAIAAGVEANAATLADAIARAPAGSWVEYSVPLIDPDRSPCCWGSYRGAQMQKGCSLDGRNYSLDRDGSTPAGRSGGELRIFLRRDPAGIDRVQAYGSDCPVDVEGQNVVVANGVTPAESLETLGSWITDEDRKVRDGALMALSNHDGAVPLLRAIVESDRPKSLRREALFWLGQVGDEEAFKVFDELLADPRARR